MELNLWLGKFYEFLDRPLFGWSRIAIALSTGLLICAFYWPLWRISMEAPQYPHGLSMDVWAYDLIGGHDGRDITEINTLNHYIGMHRIERSEFADLDWLPFAFGILGILALRLAAIGNIRSLIDMGVITFYVLAFAAARFVYKLYMYGHDLDPRAPFTVEPFTPVIVGTKQVANFTTHSYPQVGTFAVALFGLIIAIIVLTHLVVGRRKASRALHQSENT